MGSNRDKNSAPPQFSSWEAYDEAMKAEPRPKGEAQ